MNALTRELLACVPIWRTAVSSPRGDDKPWLGVLLLGIAIAVSGALWLLYPPLKGVSPAFAIGVPLAAYASIMWQRFLRGATLQNTPANGMLVPRLAMRLRRTAILAYAACVASWVIVASALPRGDKIILIVCLIITGSMVAFARPRLFYAAFFVLWGWNMAEQVFNFPNFLWAESTIGLSYVLIALLTWWAFGVTFKAGGYAHRDRAMANRIANSFSEPIGQRFIRDRMLVGRRYARMLRGDIAGGKACDLMLHALGPSNHRYDYLWELPLIAAFGIVPKLVSDRLWPGQMPFIVELSGMLSIGAFALMMLLSPLRFLYNMPTTGTEQSLFRLAPMAPSARELNRVLAGKLLRICLAEWAACALLTLAVAMVWRLPVAVMVLLVVGICALLAVTGWPLRDHARASAMVSWKALVPLALMLAVSVLSVMMFKKIGPLVLALPVAASAVLILRSWRAMVAAPVAFPASRMHTLSA